MGERLKGAFHGCPHHDDDYEACIQYSGTAPCGAAAIFHGSVGLTFANAKNTHAERSLYCAGGNPSS